MECYLQNIDETSDDEDFDAHPIPISNKKSSKKLHRKKRKVIVSEVGDLEGLLIAQNVHVEKQEINCVINLNTSICDGKTKKNERKSLKNSRKSKDDSLERIVPKCSRSSCQCIINDIIRRKNKHKKHKLRNPKKYKSHKKRTDKLNIDTKSKKRKQSKKSKKEEPKKYEINTSLSLSSVSLSPFVSDISYEDISLDSFTCGSDDELDTLIKRAKERERNISVSTKFSSKKPFYTSTPVIELSSDEELFTLDVMKNVSIHSIETFVIENQGVDMAYSPIASPDNIPVECQDNMEENNNKMTSSPTFDLKCDVLSLNTKNTSRYCFDNNNIERHINNYTKKDVLINKVELNLKTSPKLYETVQCDPNLSNVGLSLNDGKLNLPCSYMNSPKGIKIEK